MAGMLTSPKMTQPHKPTAAWIRWSAQVLPCLIAFGLASLSLWLFTRHNDFPIYYHPDEMSKVSQLVDPDQQRNYNHPLLMLEAATLAMKWSPESDSAQELVMLGRWTSATLAATGVLALALAGYAAYGYTGLLISGTVMALCPPLLVYAHYFKEDTALACGIMLTILGARLVVGSKRFWPQMLAVVVLGIGCAVAVSGKYVGAVVLLPCLLALIIAPLESWPALPVRLAVFIVSSIAAVIIINHRAFLDWSSLQLTPFALEKIEEEFDHGLSGHGGIALRKPNTFCLRITASEMMPHLWGFSAIGMAWTLARRHFSRWGFVLGSFLICFAIALSFNAIPFPRYALPITICGYFIAGQLISSLLVEAQQLWRQWGQLAAVACLGMILLLQGQRCLNFNDQFRDDSRQRLREWIARNLPPGSSIAIDSYTLLDKPGDPLRHPNQSPLRMRIISEMFAANAAASLEDLASSGVSYVAVASMNYQRFLDPEIRPANRSDWYLARQQKFYRDLFSQGKLLWSSVPSPPTNSYANCEVRLYQISHLSRQARRTGSQVGG